MPMSLNHWENTAQDRDFRNKTNENWTKIEESYTKIEGDAKAATDLAKKAVIGIKSKNLFDQTDITSGYFVNSSSGNLGTLIGYNASNYIPIQASVGYVVSGTSEQAAFYDVNKNYISGLPFSNTPFVSPSNAAYIRMTVKDSQLNTVQLEKGTTATSYESFTPKVDESLLIADSVKGKHISAGEISSEKLSFYPLIGLKSKNLFDKNAITAGYYVANATGNLASLAGYNASNFIPVLPNTQYKISGTGEQGAFYDSSKKYISGYTSASSVPVTPSNAYYMRQTVKDSQLSFVQLEKGTVITSYEPFGTSLDVDSIKTPIPEEKLSLDQNLIRGIPSKNLFNKATVTPGYYVSNTTGNLGALVGYNASDYIPVLPSISYVISGTGEQLAFYDSNKVYISGLDFASKLTTTPANAAYIRMTVKDSQLSVVQLEKGTVITSYEPFGAKIGANQVTFPIPTAEIITLTVKPDGTGDYFSPKLANDSIADSSPKKLYNIIIYPGTYTEIGWRLKPYVNLIGKHRKTCWLKGELPDTATESEIQANSTIWVDDTNNLENLTITAKNMRYAVHDESSGNKKDWIRNIKNCHIEHYGNQPGKWTSQCAYGCGISSGAKIYAENTTFKSPFAPFSVHNNVNFDKPAFVHLKGCRIEYVEQGRTPSSLRVQSLGSDADDIVILEGCYLNAPVVHNDTPWLGNPNATTHIEWQVRGYGNTPNTTMNSYFATGETDTLKFTV